MLRWSHSVHLAVCTVTRLYSVSSTVQGWIDDPPGVRGARVGNGLLDARGVPWRGGRLCRPGVDGAGEGAGVDDVGALARRPGPGVAGGSMAPRSEPCSGGSASESLILFSCLVLAENGSTQNWNAVPWNRWNRWQRWKENWEVGLIYLGNLRLVNGLRSRLSVSLSCRWNCCL
jgi:hypothetical protein